MKAKLLSTFFSVLSLFAFSQINLEHTFTSTIGSTMNVNTNNQTMYYIHDATTHTLTLYNNDYSLYKTITPTPPSGYQYATSFNLVGGTISTKVFNTDNLVEFAYIYQSTGTPTTYKLILYNENLQIVKDFGPRLSMYIFETVNNVTKCNVLGFVQDPNPPYTMTYYNDIYSLPGSLPVGVMENPISGSDIKPFPNPASSSIIIPISLSEGETSLINFYSQSGYLINSFPINCHETQFIYDVKSLSPGLYVYQYKNVSGKFIVQ